LIRRSKRRNGNKEKKKKKKEAMTRDEPLSTLHFIRLTYFQTYKLSCRCWLSFFHCTIGPLVEILFWGLQKYQLVWLTGTACDSLRLVPGPGRVVSMK
jgi:hypothetical protein